MPSCEHKYALSHSTVQSIPRCRECRLLLADDTLPTDPRAEWLAEPGAHVFARTSRNPILSPNAMSF